ncbi:MAG TPA: cytidylate kinase-like family protein [Pyrinomonadaceae bacterium]|jgi:cytidylate kinase|nr:cytidylate kinase-like family protein [Pyrinomonadaceae bacterium]
MIKTTITISRQMGSGGSYVGQLIAKQLGLKYIDREVLHLAAKEFGCDEETIAARSERVRSFWEQVLGGLSLGGPDSTYNPPPLGNFSDRELFEKQTQILKRIASQEDCVVVGWAGVFLLPRHRGMFSVFCHAPKSFRVKRLMSIYKDLTEENTRALISESDRTREIYFNQMTDHDWTCAKNYHLSIDTSLQPLERIADLIIDLSRRHGDAAAA